MARVTAPKCNCDCKMKRLYTRAEGGKGWDGVGWMCLCGCGCVSMDEGEWTMTSCCQPQAEPTYRRETNALPMDDEQASTTSCC